MALSDPKYGALPLNLIEAIYRAGIRAGEELIAQGEPDMANLGDFELNSLVDDLAVQVLGVQWPIRDSDRYEAGYPADELKREAAAELKIALGASASTPASSPASPATGAAGTLLTPEQIAALPLPTSAQEIPAELLARLDGLCTAGFSGAGKFYAGEGASGFLVGALFGLFYGGQVDEARIAAAREVLGHFGYVAENTAAADVLAALEAIEASEWHSEQYDRLTLYGAAVALASGDPYPAITMLDGPEGAGIGWVMTREELAAKIGK